MDTGKLIDGLVSGMQTILPATILSKWFTGTRCHVRNVKQQQLTRRKVTTITFPSEGRIQCLSGKLWITRDGRREDILLAAGSGNPFPAGSRIVIEALEDSGYEVAGD